MTALAAMTSAEHDADRERWQRTPHPYVCEYPRYPCATCGMWPGFPIHQTSPGTGAPDPIPAGLRRRGS